jgi:hypothetical protein
MAFIDYGCYIWKNDELLLPRDQYDKAKKYLDSLKEKEYSVEALDKDARLIDGHGAVYGKNFILSVLKDDCCFLTLVDHQNKKLIPNRLDNLINRDCGIIWLKYRDKKEYTIEYKNEDIHLIMTTETPGIKNYDGRLCKYIIIDKETNDEYIIIIGAEYGTNASSLEDIDGAYTYPNGEPVECEVLQKEKLYNDFLEVFKTLDNKYEIEKFLWESWTWPSPYFKASRYLEISDYSFGRIRSRQKALRLQGNIRPFMKYGLVPIKFKYRGRLR